VPLEFDPIAEAHRQWLVRWPEHAEHMAAVTSVMRVQQMLIGEIDRSLKPYGLTFASYEALRLLAFTRDGELPMGKIGERLMVHPASVTNTVDKLERAGMVRRRTAVEDRRRVLASITPDGRDLVEKATETLNAAQFALDGIDTETAVAISALLRKVRERGNDFTSDAHDPWAYDGGVSE
jgi:DNA-binding MarR family transcriptional regulator